MSKRFDNFFAAFMLTAAVAVALAGAWCLSRPIKQTQVDLAPPPILVAETHLELPEPAPEPSSTPTYNPSIPLSADLQAVLYEVCAEKGVPVALAFGLIEVESGFQVDAVSPEGCVGLMQINPVYAWRMEAETGFSYLTPEGNLCCGIWYLSNLIGQYDGSVEKALVAYNQGSYKGTVTLYAQKVLRSASEWEKVIG